MHGPNQAGQGVAVGGVTPRQHLPVQLDDIGVQLKQPVKLNRFIPATKAIQRNQKTVGLKAFDGSNKLHFVSGGVLLDFEHNPRSRQTAFCGNAGKGGAVVGGTQQVARVKVDE